MAFDAGGESMVMLMLLVELRMVVKLMLMVVLRVVVMLMVFLWC